MAALFKKSKKSGSELSFVDLDGIPLSEGDMVISLRYELGRCRIIRTENGMAYESVESGKQVGWAKMIDASTKNQKVRKIR